MPGFYKMLGGIFIAVCADLVLSSFVEEDSFKKLISAGCFIFALYMILDFSHKYLLNLLTRFLP